MTRHETNKRGMYRTLNSVFQSNVLLISDLPVLTTAINKLNTTVEQIDTVNEKYLLAVGGKTETKNLAEDALLEDVMPIKSALYALGIATGNEELKSLSVGSESSLKKMRDGDFLAKCKMIKKEAVTRSTDLSPYKITESMLTELQEKIDEFEEALGGKDSGLTNRSALRKELSEKFDEADAIIEHEIDTMMELVRKSQPLFYDQYQAARAIRDLGSSHKVVEEEKKTGGN
ncbi:MAG: hypothetical protein WCZ90_03845 [Melioribacteraceae bacterium]